MLFVISFNNSSLDIFTLEEILLITSIFITTNSANIPFRSLFLL